MPLSLFLLSLMTPFKGDDADDNNIIGVPMTTALTTASVCR